MSILLPCFSKLETCFLNEKEIKLWEDGHEFKDPWPKKIVRTGN